MSDDKDTYHGNGRLSGALGKGYAYAVIPFTIASTCNNLAPIHNSRGLAITGMVAGGVSLIAGITGLVQGWNKADTAIKDHEALVKERDMYKNVVNDAEHKGTVQAEPAMEASRA
jgi:hypothetical protein